MNSLQDDDTYAHCDTGTGLNLYVPVFSTTPHYYSSSTALWKNMFFDEKTSYHRLLGGKSVHVSKRTVFR